MLLFWMFTLIPSSWSQALVTDGRATGVSGESAVLSCKLGDTTETLTQISWQRRTKEKPVNDNFYIIESTNKPRFVNGEDDRFKFLGNFGAKDGTIQLSNIALKDEGSYTCIFTLFPSGNFRSEIPLTVLVPPAISLKEDVLILGDKEARIASCVAAGSKPLPVVKWNTTGLGEEVRITTNTTQHENGTTTAVSSLFGTPTMDINGGSVQCVVTSEALRGEEIRNLTIQLNFPPFEVHISEDHTSKDSFECISKAHPPASITWSRSGQSLPQSVRTEGGRLHLSTKTSDLTGLYQCEAKNPYGRTDSHLYVYISTECCTTCWVLFGLLLSINLVVLVWICYRYWKRRRRNGADCRRDPPPALADNSTEAVPLADVND